MDDEDAGKSQSQGKRQVESIPDGSSSEGEGDGLNLSLTLGLLTSKSGMGDTKKKPAKGARIVWTATLQEKFVDAVNHLGVADARPSSIMTLMNVDGLTEPIVKSHLKKYRRSLREQQRSESEGVTLGAQQASEGGKSGVDVDQVFVAGNMVKGVNASDADKVFDKMSQRTWDSKSCATQITVSSSASQHEVSSPSASASAAAASKSLWSNSIPLDLVCWGHQHEDEDSYRPLQKDKMFSILLTPSDVGQLNRLVIPKDYARGYLPKFYPGGNSLQLSIEDPLGKSWNFSYIYQSSSDTYLLTQGWSSFVEENLLRAGDTVSFYCGRGEQGEKKLFICWTRKEEDAVYTFTPSTLDLDTKTSFMAEARSKLESMVKLVVNIVRWKRRALSRHRNRTMNDLLQEEYAVAESPHNGSYVQDMEYWDNHLLEQMFFRSIADDALFYCALFPPDHEFEKDTLVQLWMALGIFIDEPTERYAGQVFEYCLRRGYFLFLRTDLVTGNAMYKFIHKTQSLPPSIGSHINLSMVSPEVTHASIRCCDLKDSTVGFQRFKQLRALIFLPGHELSFKQVPRNFFLSLRELQVLDLSKTHLMELPTSIGIMKCLCLLDLSGTLIKRLPEAIGCLEKLQTLKLKGCLNISTLPKGMRKLVNLRHLDFDVFRQLRSMPEWMGNLTNIQTLSAFLVGVEKGCSIGQIKKMDKLSGSFCISRLENVLTKDEAKEASLSDKTQLKKIELHWSDSQDEDVVGYEKVLSSLQPNTGLEELNISCYGGLEFPSWICDPKFSQLVCITLFECENCLVLPSLGQLPSLKYLNIVNFHKLKVIDHNFYGDLGIQGYVSFPKLQKLTVENMSSLEKWSGIRSFDFPCLLNLTVKHCPKLHSLCTLSSLCSLKNLEISHCAVLASCPDGKLPARVETFIIESCPLISVRFLNGGQDSQSVAHIPHIWIDHREFSLG